MDRHCDHWMPFRRRGAAQSDLGIGERVRREVIVPLEALVKRISGPPGEIPGATRKSLEDVLTTVIESFAATNRAGEVDTLEQALVGWEVRLQAFARTGGEVSLKRIGRIPDPGREAARQLYLAVREAIGNAIKHAAATRIEVLVVPWQKGCAVTVADNGRGITGGKAGGIGMETMRRRMARCGGNVLVHPMEGTVIEFRLPSPSRSLWDWLQASGRLSRGVATARTGEIVHRWQERVDHCGSLEAVFTGWPAAAAWIESRLPASRLPPAGHANLPGWIESELRHIGGGELIESEFRDDHARCRISWHGEIDPLHWLELGLVAQLGRPVMLRVTGSTSLEILAASDPERLPAPGTTGSFSALVHNTWSAGLPAARDDFSSYLHDVLAQELVAESMRWEIAREACPPGPLRTRYDQCQHELQQIAVRARSLSHELAEH